MIRGKIRVHIFSLLLGAMRPSKPSARTLGVHNQSSDDNVYSSENFFKEGSPAATLTGNIVRYKVPPWVAMLPFLSFFPFCHKESAVGFAHSSQVSLLRVLP